MLNFEPQFDEFWLLYDKKRSRKKALKLWDKLDYSQKEDIMLSLPNYIASTPDKQFRKDPCTYLYNESWEDEIIITKKLINGLDTESRQSAVLDTSY